MTARVLILGGGVAGLETLLALHELAGERAEITLAAPDPDFLYKPLLVEEPFGFGPAERYELAPLAAELGARFIQQAATGVRPGDHIAELGDGSELGYDFLVVCVGGRFRPALERAITFPSDQLLRVDALFAEAEEGSIAFVVPPGVTWSLPIYEVALMTQRRAQQKGFTSVRFSIVTPETSPLALFGPIASSAVGELLDARGIEVCPRTYVRETESGDLLLTPGSERLEASAVIALPTMDGPAIPGLPADESGFIPVDDHSRVRGVEDVYAAGDGTTFPIKQGGLATQQADAAAAEVASRLGAPIDPEPFHPVLRGKLLVGGESLHLRADLVGGGVGEVSPDCLWWPPHKISGRYLAPWLYRAEPHVDPEPPGRSLDIEVSLPREWHEQPMSLDAYKPPPVG